MTDPETGTEDDKLRLFLIYFLLSPNVTDSEVEELSSALQNSGVSLASLTYLKRMRTYSMIGNKSLEYSSGGQGGTTKAASMFSSLISQSSNFVMAGVKNLVVKKHNLPLTKIVDDIMEQKQGKYNDEYKYLDPKILRGNEGGQIPRTKTTFNDSIVFVVGGGNYIEYQNLQDYVKNKNAGHTSSACKSDLENKSLLINQCFSECSISKEDCVRMYPDDECGPVPQSAHASWQGDIWRTILVRE